jgi:hypothetical protein
MVVPGLAGAGGAGSADWATLYNYDEAGRMERLLDPRINGNAGFEYLWKTNANLIEESITPTGITSRRSYDIGGRL